jgi:hypothetical protein
MVFMYAKTYFFETLIGILFFLKRMVAATKLHFYLSKLVGYIVNKYSANR